MFANYVDSLGCVAGASAVLLYVLPGHVLTNYFTIMIVRIALSI
jgi:hypothetical protein